MADKSKPGRSYRIGFRPVMNSQHTPNNILVDVDTERQRDLLGDAGTTPVGITTFHCNDRVNEFFLRSLRARPTLAAA